MPPVARKPDFLPQPPTNTSMAWTHRIYLMRRKGDSWWAKSTIPKLGFDLPTEFEWTKKDDTTGLKKYIDLLLADRASEAQFFENVGSVINPQYLPESEDKGLGTIVVNFRAFLGLIEMRDNLRIPLWRKMRFLTNGARLVPTQFILAMSGIPGFEHLAVGAEKWRIASRADLERMNLSEDDVHSGMYADQPPLRREPEKASAAEDAPVSIPAKEIQIDRHGHDKYFELLTQVVPREGARYFVRRLILYSGALLWSGTSYQMHGPWTEYERDDAAIMATGLSL